MKRLLLLLLFAIPAQAQVAVSLSPVPHIQFLNNSGVPLANGCVFTYSAGTTTPAVTYVESTGTAANTNPIILNAGGFADIWLPNAAYKFKVVSAGGVACASGVTQWTVDGITGILGLLNLNNIWTGSNTFTSPVIITPNSNQLVLGTAGNQTTLNFPAPAGNITQNMLSTADTYVGVAASQTLTNKTLTSPIINSPNINNTAITETITANGATAPSTFLLAKLTGAPSTSTLAATVDTGGIIGICLVNCGVLGGAAQIGVTGTALCTYDGATTAGDYVQNSPTIAGECHDAGAAYPGTGQVIGRVLSTTGGGNASTQIFGPEIKSANIVTFTTASAATTASIGTTTMATAGSAGNTYRFSFYATQTALGNTCSTNTTLAIGLTYTDPSAGGPVTLSFPGQTITTNGTVGAFIGTTGSPTTLTFRSKLATTVSYQTTYAPGTCVTPPTYQIYPVLEQLTTN